MVKALEQSQSNFGVQGDMDKQVGVYKQMIFQRDEQIRYLQEKSID